MMVSLRRGVLAVVVAVLALTTAATADGFDEKRVGDFYRGKTVRIIVGFSAGGGFDTYTRLIARHLGRHIPGTPTVIVENMPGAGTVIAANHVYNSAPKDGTVIGNIGGPIIFDQLFGNPGVQYDLAKFRYLAVPARETYLMIVTKKSGVTRLEELIGPNAKQVTFGGIGGSLVGYGAILVRDVLGANLKVVSGYKGTSEVRLAMDSGEVQGIFNTWTSAKVTAAEKLKNGEWVILAQLGDEPIPNLPTPNVPTIAQMAKTAEQQQLLRFGASSPSQFGKLYVMAPGVPEDRAAALEAAFAKALADRELLAEAARAGFEIDPMSGAEAHRLVVDLLNMTPAVKAKLANILKPGKR